jgi:hypothetical protein
VGNSFDAMPNTWMATVPERNFPSPNTNTETKRTPGKFQQNFTETTGIGTNQTFNHSSEFNE